MRILLITQLFQPEPTLYGLPFAKELTKLGHEVQALTGFPNYPGGKLYDGYKVKLLQHEIMEGVSVVRVPLYPSHDKSGFRRFLNYASYALSAATIGPWVIKRPDVAHVFYPTGTACLPACILRILRGVPFVYNIQDIWPDALVSSTMFKNKFGIWLVDQWCRFCYKMASRIIAQSPGFKKELSNNRGVPPEKIKIIYNWCDDSQIKAKEKDPVLAKELGMDSKFNILFAGGMGKGQALSAVLDAANILQDKYPDIQFVFIGHGIETDDLKQKKNDLSLNNVRFFARRPSSEIGAILSLADVLLVHLKDNLLHEITIPSKVQAYMAVGKPILVGVRGDAADLVLKAGAGLKCQPENPQDIADTVLKFREMPQTELNKMGLKGKNFYQQELSLAIGTKRYDEIFKEIVEEQQKNKTK